MAMKTLKQKFRRGVLQAELGGLRLLLAMGFAGLLAAPAGEITEDQLAQRSEVECGTLVYAKDKTSICFADRFLTMASAATTVEVRLKFKEVRLDDPGQLFATPFVVFSGEGNFTLSQRERDNLRRFLELGGFMVASPGCSDSAWERAFRREIAVIFPDVKMVEVPMSHPAFSTVYKIGRLTDKKGAHVMVEGLFLDGRLALVHSPEGLNDVGHAAGCCCCGGNEISQCANVNVNLLAFAILE
jgi:hypothetical protein